MRQLRNSTSEKLLKWNFEMRGRQNRVIYDLVFITKHEEGIKTMKNSMWRVRSGDGHFVFSDKEFCDAENTTTTKMPDDDKWCKDAALLLLEKYKGKEATLTEIEWFIWLDSPFIFRKSILKWLEKNKMIVVTSTCGDRKEGYFPPEKILTIAFKQEEPRKRPLEDRTNTFVPRKKTKVIETEGKENVLISN